MPNQPRELNLKLYVNRGRFGQPVCTYNGTRETTGRHVAYFNQQARDIFPIERHFDIYVDDANQVIGLKFHAYGKASISCCGNAQHSLGTAMHSLGTAMHKLGCRPRTAFAVVRAPDGCPCQFLIELTQGVPTDE